VVLDAPMLDFRRTVEFGASHRRLPLVGLPLPPALTAVATTIAGWRYDIAWSRIDYLDGRWLRVPALIFHGTADRTVPIATSDEFARHHRGLVHEVRVRGAQHVESWNVEPRGYTSALTSYLAALPG
jgi:pimeloyl-ACP methyl ester carboxylesterase